MIPSHAAPPTVPLTVRLCHTQAASATTSSGPLAPPATQARRTPAAATRSRPGSRSTRTLRRVRVRVRVRVAGVPGPGRVSLRLPVPVSCMALPVACSDSLTGRLRARRMPLPVALIVTGRFTLRLPVALPVADTFGHCRAFKVCLVCLRVLFGPDVLCRLGVCSIILAGTPSMFS